ncbi:hypothetical protein AK830_g5403 [Neonectria ditissima]|uniref:Heterokaryon incompatibility domain-containing protein n=1 Tax=Neonectria ditissima TaxID=78410 RepID=A0A0P7BEE0_9HYPO|nr:hypothetical protein AK830_g5403 [Neonectria ditissima]
MSNSASRDRQLATGAILRQPAAAILGQGTNDSQTLPLERQNCQVCSGIIDFFKIDHSDQMRDESRSLGNLRDLVDMPCPHAHLIRSMWQRSTRTINMYPPSLAAWTVHIESYYDFFQIRFLSSIEGIKTSPFLELVAKPDQPGHPGTSRILDSEWIDVSIPRSWLKTCLCEHGSSCDEPLLTTKGQSGTSMNPDWLIDVEEQCVVPFSSETAAYLTLSYTWGSVESVTNTTGTLQRLRKPNSLHPDNKEAVPRTIRDAMGITKCLGQRYLWVDRLCISQDDKAATHRSLNAMHHIFANSVVCLVALVGKDANHGLRGFRGISEPRRVDQTALDIAGSDKLSWFSQLLHFPWLEYGNGLMWNERGWTYQEFIFAKRRLIFTGGALRWVCPRGRLGEETLTIISSHRCPPMPSAGWMELPRPGLTWVSHIASEFNKRHLKYQEDALRAFLGVQNFMNGYFLGGLNYGHPEIFFDYSLVWEGEVERRVPSVAVHPEEDNLPSWSWLGWKGDFEFICNAEYENGRPFDGILEPVAEWFAMQSPSVPPAERRAIKCTWHYYRTLAQSDPGQVLEGWKRVVSDSRPPLYEFRGAKFRYPVPLPSSTEASEPATQLQLLFAKTSRAFFLTRRPRPEFARNNIFNLIVELYSTSGKFAGLLRVHKESDIDQFLAQGTVEITAVAKGWTQDFDGYLRASEERKKFLKDTAQMPRFPFYFGLCIRWEKGVAKRQATEKILTEL